MKEFWNDRYKNEAYAYGEEPNEYLKSQLADLKPGKILFPGEGEGRNAVFTSSLGWEVHAFDISEAGKQKAMQLAKDKNVTIDYQVGDFLKMGFPINSFDAVALIYAHFPPNLLSNYHQRVSNLIKLNGLLILEGFSKNNLPLRIENPKVGGPDKIEMLFSMESIKKDFPNFEILELKEALIELKEGVYHEGTAKVIRFVGRKKS